ncbi:MAG: hypothetical protein M3Y56_00490 [Armatimonadota bacterium]|nr:hypothetical protein [Armatimonadota bacterium]
MQFDEQGHIVWSPKELYQAAVDDPRGLVNGFLMTGTPCAFQTYSQYYDFLDAVAERTGIHPKNLYLRGSCHIGFSIAPKSKVWTAMRHNSDLDLVIVDPSYYHRFDQEIRSWDDRNSTEFLSEAEAQAYVRRQKDRRYNFCRDNDLPSVVCVHHKGTMKRVADLAHCGHWRKVSAFIYPDWHSAQERYLYDLRELQKGIEKGELTRPGDTPLPSEGRKYSR